MNEKSKSFWENYYSSHRNPAGPSMFAEFVHPFVRPDDHIAEIGCGNGRDSIYFAQTGARLTAIDQCQEEVDYLNGKFENLENLNFQAGDMGKLQPISQLTKIYSRFSIHSIDRTAEAAVFDWAAAHLPAGGLFFIEARTTKDELYGEGTAVGEHEFRTDHYRRFIVPAEIEALAQAKGFRVLYSLESQGLAPYKDEDPMVIRLILER